MKVVTWNCNMAFRKKYDKLIDLYSPDIMLIQECESLEKLSRLNEVYDIFWSGDNPNKGIGIFVKKEYKCEEIKIEIGKVRHILGVGVGKFKILNFWAMNNVIDSKHRYIANVWMSLQLNKQLINDYTIIGGDFNWNIIWDKGNRPLYGNLNNVVRFLGERDLKSVYHSIRNEEFGLEKSPTLFMYRKEERPYHIDYIFTSKQIIQSIYDFQVGEYNQWIKYSDHMPIMMDFK